MSFQFARPVNDLHRPPAEDITRPDDRRVFSAVACAASCMDVTMRGKLIPSRPSSASGLLAVFGRIDTVHIRTDQRRAGCGQLARQVDRRLPAELGDDPSGFSLRMISCTSSAVSGSK